MSSNAVNINYNDFKSICRVCLSNGGHLKPLQQNSIIIETLQILICNFETNDELPQQICFNCFEKLYEIHVFASRCRQTHTSLINCLTDFKVTDIKVEENFINTETIEIEQEVLDKDEISCEIGPVPLQQFNENSEEPTIVKTGNEEVDQTGTNLKKLDEYKCEICGQIFQCSKNYQLHKNVHIHKGPFKCDVCSKMFLKSAYLYAHKKTHSRKYQCDICNRKFRDANSVSNHRQTHKEDRPHKCNMCFKAFKRRRHLETHQRVHSGERPAKCHLCPKSFKSFGNLAAHLKTHSSERPYKCDVCHKGFKILFTMQKHLKLHNGETHKCDCCEKTFIDLTSLNKHKLLFH